MRDVFTFSLWVLCTVSTQCAAGPRGRLHQQGVAIFNVLTESRQAVRDCGKQRPCRRRHHRRPMDSYNRTASPVDLLLKSDEPPSVVLGRAQDVLRRDWCRTEPLFQKVREPGCRTKVVRNRYCYGQCNSFFVPGTGNRSAFESCSACAPVRTRTVTVNLVCPRLVPPVRRTTVLKVEKCRCTALPASAKR